MPYKIAKSMPPRRSDALMSKVADHSGVAPYDLVAPGLYEGEIVVELDTGEAIAVSVARSRKPNGGGMDFRGWARQINPDGSTVIDPDGQEMELEFPCSPSAAMLDAAGTADESGEDRIAREIMLLMLGEEPTMVPVHVDETAPVREIAIDTADHVLHPEKLPPGSWLEPTATEAPLLGFSDEVRLNASIRYAIRMAGSATAEVDVGPLLRKG